MWSCPTAFNMHPGLRACKIGAAAVMRCVTLPHVTGKNPVQPCGPSTDLISASQSITRPLLHPAASSRESLDSAVQEMLSANLQAHIS
jgi:hypothetical protein